MTATGGTAHLDELVQTRRVVVCTGTGGVGKTTTAAALALEAARRGRRAVVVTVDPAKRLADTLGTRLGSTPTEIDGDWPGELWALMLDTRSTFDRLVRRYAADEAQASRILGNRFYRNLADALSGTQEYMAAETLYELHHEGDHELVVVDTPPTRNALDFLDAPRRLSAFLDHRLFRLLVAPTRAYLRAVNVAAQAFLRTAGKVVGSEALEDAIGFFSAFEGMEEGFRRRAEAVRAVLADPATAYVLVASPRADTVEEATYFAGRLEDMGQPVSALVVNRVHPRFGGHDAAAASARAAAHEGTDLGALWANLADLLTLVEAEEAEVATLAARVGPAPVVRVPFLPHDVHDLDTLAEVAAALVSPARA